MLIDPVIIPLNDNGLFALRDDQGQLVGTGSREVCEVLLHVLKSCKSAKEQLPPDPLTMRRERLNIRAAISI
jgi:hypothetical protein